MIVSLNLPEEAVAFIDKMATECKQSRSAWMTDALRKMQLMDSPAGRKGFAHLVLGVMAERALRAGQPLERVRQLFPDFERELPALAAGPSGSAPQLPAADASPAPPAPQSVPVTRRRPYQRAGTRAATFTCPCPADRHG